MPTVVARRAKTSPIKVRQRIDIRLHPHQKESIEKAAGIKGLTVTDFIVQNAVENAQRTIREYETWTLEQPDAELFARALLNPPSLGPRLAQAARNYKRQLLQP